MNYKVIALLLGVVAALSYCVGRYMTPPDVKIETKIQKVIEKDEKIRRVIVFVEKPDGSKETTVTEDRETSTNTNVTKEKIKEVYSRKKPLNISILGGAQPHLFKGISLGPIVYGASISKEVLGPITIGAFGLSDLTFGVSLGWNF